MVYNDYEIGNSTRILEKRAKANVYYDRFLASQGGYSALFLPPIIGAGCFIFFFKKFRNEKFFLKYIGSLYMAGSLLGYSFIWLRINFGSGEHPGMLKHSSDIINQLDAIDHKIADLV